MKILKEIKNTLSVTGQAAIDIAKKVREHVDENIKTKDLQKEMEEKFREIGFMVYEMSQRKENKNEEIRQLCKEIKELEQILQGKAEEKDIESFQKAQEEPVKKEVKAEEFPKQNGYLLLSFCPKCHVGNPPEAKQCISCGYVFK